jgi:GT2 family glycosyltransferase
MVEPQHKPLSGFRLPGTRKGVLDDCSLVIATYQRPHEVMKLLGEMRTQPELPAEVAIIDGSPMDDLRHLLCLWRLECDTPFDVIYARGVRGLTRQRNAGIDITSREFVFFLDDDAIPAPMYFHHIRCALKSSDRMGGACGYVALAADAGVSRRWKIRFALGLVPPIEPFTYHESGTGVPAANLAPFSGWRAVDYLPGCAFALRRAVFEHDRFSAFFSGYSLGEDLEMSLRVAARWDLCCVGDARAVHYQAQIARPPGYERGKMDVRNRFFIRKRHRPHAAFINRLRFWTDIALQTSLDLIRTLTGPARTQALAHAGGLAVGAIGCLLAPPCYDEPPACSEYTFVECADNVGSELVYDTTREV